MKKQDIEKNRNELFEAIPKLKNIYKKSIFYVFIIKLLILLITPLSILVLNQINIIKINWLFPVLIIFVFINLVYLSTIFLNYWRNITKQWSVFFKKILLPLFEMGSKQEAYEALSESGLLYSQNINFNKLNIIDYLTIGASYHKKWYCLLLMNPFFIFEAFWFFFSFKNRRNIFLKGEYQAMNNIYGIKSFTNNFYFYPYYGWDIQKNGKNMSKPSFLLKETEERLLKYIKEKKKK